MMNKRKQERGYAHGLKQIRHALVIEIILALCVASAVVFVGLDTLAKQTNQYAANINTDYHATVDGYIHEYQMMSIEIKEKLKEDPSLEEMSQWLMSRDEVYKNAAGEEVYRGIGLSYKGAVINSWNGVNRSMDPTSRPWYQKAEAAGGDIVVVSPYITYEEGGSAGMIVMGIAEKINEDVTIVYDIKNTGLKKMLANRELIYDDTLMLLCDDQGYILSSSDADQFGHNVFTKDEVISADFSAQMAGLTQSQNKLHFTRIDNTWMVASATTNEDGLLFFKMIPITSVFVQDFLFITIIIILVTAFLIGLYCQNKQRLKEFQRKDERLTCITNASYDERVYVDIETMEFYGNEWADESCDTDQYAELFKKVRSRVANQSDQIKYDSFLSEKALKSAMDKMYKMESEQFTVKWPDPETGEEKEAVLEISRLASEIDRRPVVGILLKDVTESAEVLKDALKHAESASQAKGDFMSRMSHEIRTPLNAIIGYMSIARDEKTDAKKVAHCLDQSTVAARHLLSIVNDILDISSIESGRMKLEKTDFDLTQMIHSLTTIFYGQAKEKNVQFKVELEELTNEWVNGDPLRVNQILLNLLSNAIKFTPENGAVTLIVRQMETIQDKIHLQFRVVDTGIGMSREYMDRIFKPFEQEDASTARNYGGTGLGLSISYNLVQMMGGKIAVASEPGKGTTFTVMLAFDPTETQRTGQLPTLSFSDVRVLVVDDEVSACEYIKKLLERCGVKCDTQNVGKKAVRRVKNRLETEHPYDMCIIDWNMSEMDGVETARQIRALCGAEMPIIVATSYDYSAIADEAKEAGVNRIIAKPLFQSTLFDLLINTFGKYEPVQSKEKKAVDFNGMKVLLAEDNAMNMEIALDILRKADMDITPVADGKEALETFVASEEGTYKAILMDIQMPVMDGYEATKAIRKSGHPQAETIPIIAMTANAFTSDVTEALAAGMDDHIAKPIDFERLFDTLSRLVKE
ncbi:hybrid sensor histidine kinase/response regulator [Hespellia stercorisuis]|uniref:Circadian input-output histidine kinase CikA n=1 Tax=Hespellia stercorisuis DSM 15480 TaxID=1121950 RepID=A0A1M6TH46_9FIRM|nr:hybrid sensor histidine kinase/response regulator [Hespellia stercorisuis]SHK56234.1 Signal transduction histidine kinase [Hespellia stercorisuis DSM 15480]